MAKKEYARREKKDKNTLWGKKKFKTKWKKKRGGDAILQSLKSGERQVVSVWDVYKEVVSGRHVKITDYGEEVYLSFKSMVTVRLYSFIRKRLKYETDYVDFTIEEARVYCKVEYPNVIYASIKELVSLDIIEVSTTPARYFINPHMIYFGEYPEDMVQKHKHNKDKLPINKEFENEGETIKYNNPDTQG